MTTTTPVELTTVYRIVDTTADDAVVYQFAVYEMADYAWQALNADQPVDAPTRYGLRTAHLDAEGNEHTPCQCESIEHASPDQRGLPEEFATDERTGTGHPEYRVAAGSRRAFWVGEVCDECADTHLASYLIPEEN